MLVALMQFIIKEIFLKDHRINTRALVLALRFLAMRLSPSYLNFLFLNFIIGKIRLTEPALPPSQPSNENSNKRFMILLILSYHIRV